MNHSGNRPIKRQWLGNLARCLKNNHHEVQFTNIHFDEWSVDYLIEQMEEFSSPDKPHFDELRLSGCRITGEKNLQRFSERVVSSARRITIDRGHPSSLRGKISEGRQLSVLLKGIQSSSFVESLTFVDLDLEWQTSNTEIKLTILELRDILNDKKHPLCDLGFLGCQINNASADYWIHGLENRAMRTLVVERCKIDNEKTIKRLVQALNSKIQDAHSPLEALALTHQHSTCTNDLLELMTFILETHHALKSLRFTRMSGVFDRVHVRDDALRRFQQSMEAHTHLQLLECPRLWTKENERILRRNYFLWRLEYVCSALTPTLELSVWPTLLECVNKGGPTPIFHFLRCHRIDEAQAHQRNPPIDEDSARSVLTQEDTHDGAFNDARPIGLESKNASRHENTVDETHPEELESKEASTSKVAANKARPEKPGLNKTNAAREAEALGNSECHWEETHVKQLNVIEASTEAVTANAAQPEKLGIDKETGEENAAKRAEEPASHIKASLENGTVYSNDDILACAGNAIRVVRTRKSCPAKRNDCYEEK